MTSEKHPDICSYLELIDRFIDSSIAAPEFEMAYLNAMKSERRILGQPVFDLLQQLFGDADAYVGDPRLRDDPDDLGDEQLHACVIRTRQALRDLGYH